eukprot:CAMPEP_0117647868 /NCGR_PEP_ID=MMETSP0804-20121206/78_1 /TAXON_ID=1074897 /ORGANISM="Tetraselmis astigmatica, Strain CCMP880" /LENGTH=342 /DNA_ID=CAMNT_0005453387 /DNA_START=114 /DNA_END=1144 /DNA_ORIENTATION=+
MAASEDWGGADHGAELWHTRVDAKNEAGPGSTRSCRSPFVPLGLNDMARFRARAATAMAAPLRPPLEGTVASLQGLCLGCIGEHIEEFLECGAGVAALLTPEQRGALASIARRRGLLHGATLKALVDPGWLMMDLSGSSRLCDPVFLSMLASLETCSLCPQLIHLRLGGSQLSTACAIKALKHILPRVQAIEEDSWEDMVNISFSNGLVQLEVLFWADCPPKQRQYLAKTCPKVAVYCHDSCVCSTPAVCSGRQTPCCWPALDLPLAEAIGPAAWRALHRSADALRREPLPIAERFRRAIDEHEAQVVAKAERNHRQRMNRQAMLNAASQPMKGGLTGTGGS